MTIKVHAPYPRFKWRHYRFDLGYRICNEQELKELKRMPIALGELRIDGKVVNKPKKKPKKKK